MSNLMWKLSEDDEKENDYKRLQKKFAFNNNNKSIKSFSQNEISFNTEKKNYYNQEGYQRENVMDSNQSLRIEDINKIIDKNEMISKKIPHQHKQKNSKNDNNIEICKSVLFSSRSKVNNASIIEEETERNMNKNVDNIENNPGLGDAVRKLTDTSIDSLKDNIMNSNISNNNNYKKINIRLPTDNNLITNNVEEFYDNKYDQKNKIRLNRNKIPNNVVITDEESIQGINFNKKGSFYKNNHNRKVYNLSSRLINDEKDHNKTISKDLKFKFLDNIEENQNKAIRINPRNFLKLTDQTFFNFLTFSYDSYDKFVKSHPLIDYKLHSSLANIFSKMIEEFRLRYKNIMDLQEYYFKYEPIRKRKFDYSGHNLNLVLRSKINCNYINKNIDITLIYKYSSTKKENSELMQSWRFDIRRRCDIAYWIASEAEEYQNKIVRYSYIQPILAISKHDFLEFHISVFSSNGIIDPLAIIWKNARLEDCPQHTFMNYEKNLIKTSIKFDLMRFCEFENIIHIWKGEESLTIKKSVDEVRKILSKLFKIHSISYDFFKFYIFKVKMTAITNGLIQRNKFINFDIEVKSKEDSINIESRALGRLNHRNHKFEIREGTSILLYFTDIYL